MISHLELETDATENAGFLRVKSSNVGEKIWSLACHGNQYFPPDNITIVSGDILGNAGAARKKPQHHSYNHGQQNGTNAWKMKKKPDCLTASSKRLGEKIVLQRQASD